jgi:hypothetical protein
MIIPPKIYTIYYYFKFCSFYRTTSTKANLTLHQYECPCRHRLS